MNTMLDRPYQPLVEWLAAQGIEYEIHEHDRAFTARATATAEGVDPRTFAKVVAVASHDGRNAIIVLDATDHLDLRKARRPRRQRRSTADRAPTDGTGARLRGRRHPGRRRTVRADDIRGLTPCGMTRRSASTRAATASAPVWSERAGSAPATSSTPTWRRTPTKVRHGHAHDHGSGRPSSQHACLDRREGGDEDRPPPARSAVIRVLMARTGIGDSAGPMPTSGSQAMTNSRGRSASGSSISWARSGIRTKPAVGKPGGCGVKGHLDLNAGGPGILNARGHVFWDSDVFALRTSPRPIQHGPARCSNPNTDDRGRTAGSSAPTPARFRPPALGTRDTDRSEGPDRGHNRHDGRAGRRATKSSARRAIVTSCASVVSKGLPECDYLPSIMNQGTQGPIRLWATEQLRGRMRIASTVCEWSGCAVGDRQSRKDGIPAERAGDSRSTFRRPSRGRR